MDEPPADVDRLTPGQFGELWDPPAIDLQRSKIMCAVPVLDLRADPARLLVS